jgi:epidermal growth factor receptor substrate 15
LDQGHYFCKFKENCKYSHGDAQNHQEGELITEECKSLKKKTRELETEVMQLESTNKNLEEQIKKKNEELEKVKNEKDVLVVQIKNITEVNEALIEDITTLNERIAFIIPGVLEEETLELKESVAILKCCLEMLNSEQSESESNANTKNNLEDTNAEINSVVAYYCEMCLFESRSQQGLNIHIGIKHKEKNQYA